MNLGEAIRISRQRVFYTQEDFAKELNVALSTINHWELNKARPNMKVMKAIKAFCNKNNLDCTLIEIELLNRS